MARLNPGTSEYKALEAKQNRGWNNLSEMDKTIFGPSTALQKLVNVKGYFSADPFDRFLQILKSFIQDFQDDDVSPASKPDASILDYITKDYARLGQVPRDKTYPQTGTMKDINPTTVPSIMDYYKRQPAGHEGLVHVSGYMRGDVAVSDYDRSWPDRDMGNNLGFKAK